MAELENENEIKKTVQDTQMLIRNCMEQHKKASKQLHSQIKKKKKTIELFKEKVAKLIHEKDKLESKKESAKADKEAENVEDPEIAAIKQQILNEVNEKKAYDDKIQEIKAEYLEIKGNMGGLNATQHLQDKNEKLIKNLENRLDKANQKFNESIEYDKKLRAEIDKLRKERFFFENIYKKLEKELEEVRNKISESLKSAYANYEERDSNQEQFESLKAQMLKTESEYVNLLQEMSNKQTFREQKKTERKQGFKAEEMPNINSKGSKNKKNENSDSNREKIMQTYQNLKYKFEKLAEFTGNPNLAEITLNKGEQQTDGVSEFCKKFKEDDNKNFELFQVISKMSSEAKQLEFEIKSMEQEIERFKAEKNSQKGKEQKNLITELTIKAQKLTAVKDQYDTDYKKSLDTFIHLKNPIQSLFDELKCKSKISDLEKKDYENGINEENALCFLSKIEDQLKANLKFLEIKKQSLQNDTTFKRAFDPTKGILNSKMLNERMGAIFNSMDNSKSKTMEQIRDSKGDEFRLDKLKEYSENFVEELYKKADRDENGDKKIEKKSKKAVLPKINN